MYDSHITTTHAWCVKAIAGLTPYADTVPEVVPIIEMYQDLGISTAPLD